MALPVCAHSVFENERSRERKEMQSSLNTRISKLLRASKLFFMCSLIVIVERSSTNRTKRELANR